MDWNLIEREWGGIGREVCGRLRPAVEQAAADMVACLRAGGKVMACGNGGSAADAQHFAAELVNRFYRDRQPYAGLALTTDTSVLTSIGNDFGYEQVFEKQVLALGAKGDVLVAISTSGNSESVCRAAATAKRHGILTVGLTGGKGGRLVALVDRPLCVGGTDNVARIQEGHQLIIHALCHAIEEALG